MKATGIVRKVDLLGRIVLPMELRNIMDISAKDALEMYLEDNSIVLRKYQPACVFCDNAHNLVVYKGKNVCKDCIKNFEKI